jgi:fructokinase
MKTQKLDILCVGEALVDFIGSEIGSLCNTKDFHKHIGGSPTNVAMNLSKLGLNVGLVSTIGADGLGQSILKELHHHKVETSSVKILEDKPTSVIMVSKTDTTPEFIPYRKADSEILPDQFETINFSTAKIFHTTCFALSRNPARTTIMNAAKAAYQAHCKLSIDVNYSKKIWPDKSEALSVIETYSRLNPLIKISEDDKERLFGKITDDEMFTYFHKLGVEVICYTIGSRGVKLSINGNVIFKPAVKIGKVIDATGAGDAFWSGFLYGTIRNHNYSESLDFALKLASLKLQSTGQLLLSPNIATDFFQN